MAGRLPEAWIAPGHLLDLRARVRLRHTLVDQRGECQQRIQAVLHHHGVAQRRDLLTTDKRQWLTELELPCPSSGASVETVTGRRLVLFVALSTSRWGHAFRRPIEQEPVQRPLTRREREVVARHAGPDQAGDRRRAAHRPDTVRTHVRNAMEKPGARSRAHLVAKARGDGHVLG